MLSFIAGSTDVIGYLAIAGLFTAHVTGNLIVLASRLVTGDPTDLGPVLAFPVFMAGVMLARVLAGLLERRGVASLRPLLLLQFVLLLAVQAMAWNGLLDHQHSASATAAGMLAVVAMAMQNALAQISVRDAPSTAVMTSNTVHVSIDLAAILVPGPSPDARKAARARLAHTLPALLGFAAGGAAGAALQARFGLLSLGLPVALSALAVILGHAPEKPGRTMEMPVHEPPGP